MPDTGWLIDMCEVNPPHVAATGVLKQDEHVVLVDHHDSFTQLIKSYCNVLGARVSVVQQDDSVLQRLESLAPTRIILSPGPGHPSGAHATQAMIKMYAGYYPILGICLGHQCLIEAFGGEVTQADQVCHGVQSKIYHTGQGLFLGLREGFLATRYHSLVVCEKTLPDDWDMVAWTYDAEDTRVIMGIQHRNYPMYGVQYHPEAILTEQGHRIFENFLCVSR
jgi:anthranilate synthase component II